MEDLNCFMIIILFTAIIIVHFSVIILAMIKLRKKNSEIKQLQQQYIAKIDIIRKEHSDTLEKIRVEMLKREEIKNRQWIESEKETLLVLNGVSTLLDLNEKLLTLESDKIFVKLDEISNKLNDLINK